MESDYKNLLNLEKAIVSTLVYFDIFEFPLTLVEIWKGLYRIPEGQNEKKFWSIREVKETLKNSKKLEKIVFSKNGFYFLKGRENLVEKRIKRYNLSQLKWKRALGAAKILQIVPFLKMIAVCNNLAFNNVKEDSDIDFFIITKTGRIWTTRILATFLMSLFGLRRHGKKIANRICLSFYITDEGLNFNKIALKPHDIYLAYWITQIVPLYEKKFQSQRFIQENEWIKGYLPNFIEFLSLPSQRKIPRINFLAKMATLEEKILDGKFGDALEKFLKKIQKNKMAGNVQSVSKEPNTKVVISDQMLKFHETDAREKYREMFEKRLSGLYL